MIKDKNIFIKNIYYMLSYALMFINHDDYNYIEKEPFENIHNLFAAILTRGIAKQLKHGLYREYINYNENINSIRGKIDINETTKNLISKRKLISCEFDNLSENNIFNQIIKTTAILLVKHDNVSKSYKSELKKEIFYFSEVDTIEPLSIRWSSIKFHRNNNSYRMLIGICQLIIEGMLLTTESGEYKFETFIKSEQMNKLYEKFILGYYVKEHEEIIAEASRISWGLDYGNDDMLPLCRQILC